MKYINEKLNNFNQFVKNKKVAIIGLGVSNIPLIDYLYDLDCKVMIFNNKNLDKSVIEKIKTYKMEVSAGENYLSKLVNFDVIFRSPSCRVDLPEIEKEVKRGAFLTSEIELLLDFFPGVIIGVTGSDGKTTTTSLIYEMLKSENLNCYLGGNIGIPLFTKLNEMTPKDYLVLELSSFQLMSMKVSPNIAVITNISPNHLDIHKSYEEYIEAKRNIFKYQKENDLLVLNYDNEITKSFKKDAKGNVVFFSRKTLLKRGVILENNYVELSENENIKQIVDVRKIKLRGNHNIENICAAIGATKDLITINSQKKSITDFSGVNHRLEFVKEINGAKWYNDSIASSPSRTIAGLNSFDEKIILIVGGYDKHLDYNPLAVPILNKVTDLILLGQTSEKIYSAVISAQKAENNKINIYRVKSLEEAVNKANQISMSGDVILFSPASASFDMFKNFEERGNKFKELVNNILIKK